MPPPLVNGPFYRVGASTTEASVPPFAPENGTPSGKGLKRDFGAAHSYAQTERVSAPYEVKKAVEAMEYGFPSSMLQLPTRSRPEAGLVGGCENEGRPPFGFSRMMESGRRAGEGQHIADPMGNLSSRSAR